MPLFQTKNNVFFKVFSKFRITDKPLYIEPYGNGNIHATFRVCTDRNCFILQEINLSVFQNIDALERNLACLKSFDPGHRLTPAAFTSSAGNYFVSEGDRFYRLTEYIPNTGREPSSLSAETIRNAAGGFASFYLKCREISPGAIETVLPRFHQLDFHRTNLQRAAACSDGKKTDVAGGSLEQLNSLLSQTVDIAGLLREGELPVTVVHNDASISNILMDKDTGEFRRVIDLDTVMPGTVLYDFGGFCRSVLSKGDRSVGMSAEDGGIDLHLFEAICEGFAPVKDILTGTEKTYLFDAIVYMTALTGTRLLADYLSGGIYYRNRTEEECLRKADHQLRLLKSLLLNEKAMRAIIESRI